MTLRVGAVVVSYRGGELLEETVSVLLAQSAPPSEVVIVDNASDDGSADRLRERFPAAQVIEAPANLGYAGGMNLGVRALTDNPEAVLLLAQDCLLDSNALAQLARTLEDDARRGCVGPLMGLREDRGRVWSAGGVIDQWGEPQYRTEPELMAQWADCGPDDVAWVDGACLLLRATALASAGPLHEPYFMNYEEVDLLVLLGLHGWRVTFVPSARAWQVPGGGPPYIEVRNRLLFLARRGRRRDLARRLGRDVVELARDVRRARWTHARQRALALVHLATRRFGAPPPSIPMR